MSTIKDKFQLLKDRLVAGGELEIPDLIMEEQFLLHPRHQSTQDFNAYLQPLLRRLAPDHDFDTKPIHGILADSGSVNAAMVGVPRNAALFIFEKEMLKTFKNESEFVHVILHEGFHKWCDDKIGMRFVGQTEEMLQTLCRLPLCKSAGLAHWRPWNGAAVV